MCTHVIKITETARKVNLQVTANDVQHRSKFKIIATLVRRLPTLDQPSKNKFNATLNRLNITSFQLLLSPRTSIRLLSYQNRGVNFRAFRYK